MTGSSPRDPMYPPGGGHIPVPPPKPRTRKPWYLRWWAIGIAIFVIVFVTAAITGANDTTRTGRPATTETAETAETAAQATSVAGTAAAATTVEPATSSRVRSGPTRHPPLTGTVRTHHTPTPPRRRVRVPGVPAKDVPDSALTPGAILPVAAGAVCVSGYSASVRDVPGSESEEAYARYGVPHVAYQHEVDHLVSLELGGSNAITNLWPEPYAGRWGARTKDSLENRLHSLVCSGSLTLASAQHQEATDWVRAYKKYVGERPERDTALSTTSRAPRTITPPNPGSSGCEPGYSPCLPIASDLNCDDISDSLKPITVTGDDPYGLDADGDGQACEP
jgi:hypothetical protein